MGGFDDSLLDDPSELAKADSWLRFLASSGARIRQESAAAEAVIGGLSTERPRAVIAVGPEARLIRAVLEPTCPVPFVAWPTHSLPAWVGPLDVVLALAPVSADHDMLIAVAEASRRGCRLVIVAPEGSLMAEHAAGRDTMLVGSTTKDHQAAALALLKVLARMGLGPEVEAADVADEVDQVAIECSPLVDVARNPAKELALGMADRLPLIWGGSILAARASRRVAEAFRTATGRPVLAGEAEDLLPTVLATQLHDPFADPEEEGLRPALIMLDDESGHISVRAAAQLKAAAQARGVRICVVKAATRGLVERYARLYAVGLFAASYTAIGLGLADRLEPQES